MNTALLIIVALLVGVNIGMLIIRRGPFARLLNVNAQLMDLQHNYLSDADAQGLYGPNQGGHHREIQNGQPVTILHIPQAYFAPQPSDGFQARLHDIDPTLSTSTIRSGALGAFDMVLYVHRPTNPPRYYSDGSGPMKQRFGIRGNDRQQDAMERLALKMAAQGTSYVDAEDARDGTIDLPPLVIN